MQATSAFWRRIPFELGRKRSFCHFYCKKLDNCLDIRKLQCLLTFSKYGSYINIACGRSRTASSEATRNQRLFIKASDPAVISAMKTLEATLEALNQSAANVQQIEEPAALRG